ncbi:UvrD-helicase domain-containing protein [Solibacillus sp. FSL K6-1523]|uniref:UvrD-helicase domain-containing protein n=1 Tax=Solibacillus sp. FSL K6-1523 TaxID=2921471 RepID=UPI0030F94336
MKRESDQLVDEELKSYVNLNEPKSFFLLAGAGSGKTRSLVTILQHIHDEHGQQLRCEGKKIGVITYTKAASEEINRRLGYTDVFQVSTIHSFAWNIIRYFQRDIKDYLIDSTQKELTILIEKIESRELRGQRPTETQQRDREKLEAQLVEWKKVNKFDYSPDTNNRATGYLGHTHVISIFQGFLISKSFFRKLFVSKYPILLIDECQDTETKLMEALIQMEKEHVNFCLGLFGDMMQRVYSSGKADLQDAIAHWENKPIKEMNWRSQERIINFNNQLRKSEDGLIQYPNKDKRHGVFMVYIRPVKPEKVREVELGILENFKEKIQIEDKKVNSLILEHKMAARRNGFLNFYESLNVGPTVNVLRDASGKELTFIRKVIFRLHEIFLAGCNKVSMLKMLREEKVLKVKDLKWRELLGIAEGLNKYLLLFNDINDKPMKDYITELHKLDLFDVPEIFLLEDKKSEKWENWNIALSCTCAEFDRYFRYKEKVDGFVTQQGSKGLEYNNVMVIINDDEQGGNQISYEKLFGVDGLSDTDKNNIRQNKDNALSRTRRLFYVAASRAKESLAIVIYTKDVNKTKEFFVNHDLAIDEEIDVGI